MLVHTLLCRLCGRDWESYHIAFVLRRQSSFLLPVTLFESRSQKSGDFETYKSCDTVEVVVVEIGVYFLLACVVTL